MTAWRCGTIKFDTCSLEGRNTFDLLRHSGGPGAKRLLAFLLHLETRTIDYLEECAGFSHESDMREDQQYHIITLEATGTINDYPASLFSIENTDWAGVLFFSNRNDCHIHTFYHPADKTTKLQVAKALFDTKMTG